jgi:RNA polymerase sigma factor (sigma-70 family)
MATEEELDVTNLVHAAKRGDHRAWEQLLRRYTSLICSVVRSYRLSASDAEDVSQLVWLRLVEHLGGIREPRALPGWIVTTTRRECLRLLSTTRYNISFDGCTEQYGPLCAEEPDFDEGLWRLQRHQALHTGLAGLPENQRQLLLLLTADPVPSYAELSRRLGIPRGSIGPTRARALGRLRQLIDALGLLADEAC